MIDFLKGTVTPRDWAAVAVILAVAVIICVAFYFGVYDRQQQTIAALNAELDEVGRNLAQARETEANIESLREEAEKMEQLVVLFEQRLPEKREIPALVSNFERLGGQLGLNVELEALPTITDQNKETIPYRVTAHGDFHQIVNFINMLERDDRYLRISDLNIDEQEDGISQGQFTLSTFRFLQQQPRQQQTEAAGGSA